MKRILTRNVGRYKKGDIKDWPRLTWNNVAKSVDKKKSMEDISKPLEQVAKENSEQKEAK